MLSELITTIRGLMSKVSPEIWIGVGSLISGLALKVYDTYFRHKEENDKTELERDKLNVSEAEQIRQELRAEAKGLRGELRATEQLYEDKLNALEALYETKIQKLQVEKDALEEAYRTLRLRHVLLEFEVEQMRSKMREANISLPVFVPTAEQREKALREMEDED
jgi:chromosome segregation ATPase